MYQSMCNIIGFPYPESLVIQWQSSGSPVCLGFRPQYTPEWFLVVSAFPVCRSGLPVCSNYANYHWTATGRTPLASASAVPVASQRTCVSSGLPGCSNYANELWIATGRPLGDSISQWSSSVVCSVVSQCTNSIWFGGQQVRSQPFMYTTGKARVVWAKLVSFELPPQIHKNYNDAHIKNIHWVMLTFGMYSRAVNSK